MKAHPNRDKKRLAQDKKQARKIAASEQETAAKPENVVPKELAPKDLAPKVLAPKDLAPKVLAPKRETVVAKREAAKLAAVAPKREELAPKPNGLAAKPKEVAPDKEAAAQREDAALKHKLVAPSAPAPQPAALLELPSAPSKPSVASPRPAHEAAAPAIEWSFEAAGQSALAMNRKLFEFAQANVTASLDLAKRLAGAKTPIEMVDLQMTYWQERISVLASQAEELRALSAELVTSASEPIKAQVRRS
jgi:hypothetical protein